VVDGAVDLMHGICSDVEPTVLKHWHWPVAWWHRINEQKLLWKGLEGSPQCTSSLSWDLDSECYTVFSLASFLSYQNV